MSDTLKQYILQEHRTISTVRDGDTFHYKTHIGDVDVDFTEKIGQQAEWEEKEKNPVMHIRVSTNVCW